MAWSSAAVRGEEEAFLYLNRVHQQDLRCAEEVVCIARRPELHKETIRKNKSHIKALPSIDWGEERRVSI